MIVVYFWNLGTFNLSLVKIYIGSAFIRTMLDENIEMKKTFLPLLNHMMKINGRFGNVRVKKWHLYVDCLQFIMSTGKLIILFDWSKWRCTSSYLRISLIFLFEFHFIGRLATDNNRTYLGWKFQIQTANSLEIQLKPNFSIHEAHEKQRDTKCIM